MCATGAGFFGAGVGNFWPALYRGDGGLPSFVEFVVGPAGSGGRVSGLRQPGLSPLPLGWTLLSGWRR